VVSVAERLAVTLISCCGAQAASRANAIPATARRFMVPPVVVADTESSGMSLERVLVLVILVVLVVWLVTALF